jgi:hypothetical protein
MPLVSKPTMPLGTVQSCQSELQHQQLYFNTPFSSFAASRRCELSMAERRLYILDGGIA